jgi:hypothetical protein
MEDFSEQQIKTLKTVVGQVVKDEIRINNDILRQEIQASEHRIKTELRKEIQQVKQDVVESVAELLDTSLLPQIDDHETRITKLEAKPA